MSKKSNNVNIIIHVIGCILSICGCFYIHSNMNVLCFICFGVFVYMLIKTISNAPTSLLFMLIPLLSLAFVLAYFEKQQTQKEIDCYGSVVTIAIVEDVYNYKGIHKIVFHYKTISDLTLHMSSSCEQEIVSNMRINDTILIEYSKLSHDRFFIYNYFPSKEEISKYKNGVPYEPKKKQ